MGSGCSRKDENYRFSLYHKIHSKKHPPTEKTYDLDNAQQTSNIKTTKKTENFKQKNIIDKIKKVTSNTVYDSIKLGKKLKQIFPESEYQIWGDFALIEELHTYVKICI